MRWVLHGQIHMFVQHIQKMLGQIKVWQIWSSSQHLELFVLYLKLFLNNLYNAGVKSIWISEPSRKPNFAYSITLPPKACIFPVVFPGMSLLQVSDAHRPGCLQDVKMNHFILYQTTQSSSFPPWSWYRAHCRHSRQWTGVIVGTLIGLQLSNPIQNKQRSIVCSYTFLS